ncbi:hypothetical protein K502DRAFT_286333, partial [Neoconidiobolus thromboides FSU 785]
MSRFYPKGERKQYICGWRSCNTGFDQLSHLVHHLSEDHVGEKPYPCTFPNCNRDFTRSDSLAKHVKSH